MSDVPAERRVVHTTGDGIEELDHRLPRWWLATFYGTLIFGIGYWFVFHVFGTAGPPELLYFTTHCRPLCTFASVDVSNDPSVVAEGQQVFAVNCATCHGPKGGGIVGPNLTDEYWLHGGSPEQIAKTICEGVPTKGMPTWGPQLGSDRIRALVAYVLTLRNTNVAGGKAPQGERLAPP